MAWKLTKWCLPGIGINRMTTIVVALLVLLSTVAGGIVGSARVVEAASGDPTAIETSAATTESHVVTPGESIQAAVDDASAGERVVLKPGIYEQQVVIRDDVTLVAPNGASLNGSGLSGDDPAVTIEGDASPVIVNISISGYGIGIDAKRASGDWVLRNVTVSDVRRGIEASGTTGDWAVRNSTITESNNGLMAAVSEGNWVVSNTTISEYADDAIGAFGSEGTWTIRDSVLRNSPGEGCYSNAVGAENTTGKWTIVDTRIVNSTCAAVATWHSEADWTVRNSTLVDAEWGVGTRFSTGNWTVVNTTVREAEVGVWAPQTTGDWKLRSVTVRESERGVSARGASGNWTVRSTTLVGYERGVVAVNTSGRWQVTKSSFLADEGIDIVARSTGPTGNATGNWWGSSGSACVGNVDCSVPLQAPPGATATPATTPTKTPNPSPTETPPPSPTPTQNPGVNESTSGSVGDDATATPTSATSPGLSLLESLFGLAVFGCFAASQYHRTE